MATTGEGKLTAWDRQLKNRNFLSPAGFKFTLQRAPKVDFFSQSVNIPGINLGVAVQPTYLKDIATPGDKLVYNDLEIEFFIDENLVNYLQVHDWMRALGFPEHFGESIPLDVNDQNPQQSAYSDGSLLVYNSSFVAVAKVDFSDLFPVSLTPISFSANATDINYIMATASFKYTIFNVESLVGNES
tara:strand:+ start:786 stop:1346 length:561 start_codon:yes stop_codon:yes gene_type:complete